MDTRAAIFWDRSADEFNRLYTEPSLAGRLIRRGLYLREREALALVRPGNSVLDLGCGPGRLLTQSLLAGAASAVGVDAAPAMLGLAGRAARQAGVEQRVEIVAGDYRRWQDPRRFDVVYTLGVFDYETDPDTLLGVARRHCRGVVAASFRRFWTVRHPLRRLYFELRGCPIRFHTRGDIERLFARNRFEVERLVTIGALFFAVGRPWRE